MKVGRYLVIIVIVMSALITFGNRGLIDNYMMRKHLISLKKAQQEIVEENAGLKRTIVLLRSDLPYIEMVARNELGMVKKEDMVYRFAK